MTLEDDKKSGNNGAGGGSYKNPPKMANDKPYKLWKTEVQLWQACCGLADGQQAPALVLSIKDDTLKQKVIDEVGVKKLESATGVTLLLTLLDGFFQKDAMVEAYDAYINFERYEKGSEIMMTDYILEYDTRYNRAKAQSCELPDKVLAIRLLDRANLSASERQLVLTAVNFSEADVYKQMKDSLKKFFGQQVMQHSPTGATNEHSEGIVKVEEALFAGASNRPWQQRGNYRQPWRRGNSNRGRGYGQYARSTPHQPMMNTIGEDGKPRQCMRCKSIYHFIKNCPVPASQDQNVGFVTEISLFTGNDADELSCLTDEAANSAVLDSGCASTVAGEGWITVYLDSLSDSQRKLVKKANSDKKFKFGAGSMCKSKGEMTLPCIVAGKACTITTDIVDTNIPLLLSKDAMKKAGTVLNLEKDEITILGETLKLECTSSGHYSIPLIEPSAEVVYFSMDGESDESKIKKVTKLHKQMAHPSESGLLRLLNDAGMKGESYKQIVHDISSNCITCKRFRKTPPRPAVCLPLAHDFNEVVVMDLKQWSKNVYFLHMIDAATRLCKAVVIKNKHPGTIISKFMTSWVGSGFGKPQKLLYDNGGEFANNELISMAENLGITVIPTAGYSPWSNGLCERNHAVVDNNVSKLLEDNPKLDLEVALAWATDAKIR